VLPGYRGCRCVACEYWRVAVSAGVACGCWSVACGCWPVALPVLAGIRAAANWSAWPACAGPCAACHRSGARAAWAGPAVAGRTPAAGGVDLAPDMT